ncbi:hypothetical protein ACJ41O_015233 [Fusarium nematophilum]
MDKLDRTINEARRAVEMPSDDDMDRAEQWDVLTWGLNDKFEATKDAEVLEEAIQAAKKAVDATPKSNYADWHKRSIYLGYLLHDKFQLANDMAVLDESIDAVKQGVDALPADDTEALIQALKALRARLSDKSGITLHIDDIQNAIQVTTLAMDITPPDHKARLDQLGDVSSLLGAKYLQTGSEDDLEQAIRLGMEAVDSAPDDNQKKACWMQHVGGLFGQRALRTGNADDLHRGIQLAAQAVELSPAEDIDRGSCLMTLGVLLVNRFAITAALADLNEGIAATRQAVEMPCANDTIRSIRLGNLAVQLQQRFVRTRALSDMDESTNLSAQALEILPEGHPDRARHQHDLGIKLARKWSVNNDLADLDAGIKFLWLAVEATPTGHPNRASYLQSLASGLVQKGTETQRVADVEEWMAVTREAIDATPEGHPDRGELLYNLGVGHLTAYLANGEVVGIEPVDCFEAALQQTNASTLHRVQACMSMLQICPDFQRSFEAAKTVMGLIPRLTPRSLDNDDRQNSLGEIAGLASDAAAVAIQAHKGVDVAVDLLEQGQGLLGASLEEIQTDVLDLRESHSELADSFERLREELSGPANMQGRIEEAPIEGAARARENQALRRYDAGREFDELVERIRKLPDFENFLRAPGLEAMNDIAEKGPIVIVNVSIICCNAFIIQWDSIESIPLPDLSRSAVEARVLKGDRGSPNVLEWLWDVIAKPVLDALGFTQPPSDGEWPHIWWIPTGLLRQFPLHAAGYHIQRASETVIDRVMSSYGSSLKAILNGRKRQVSPKNSPKAVLVAMENTPARTRLPFVTQEIKAVKNLCASMGLEAVEPYRMKDEVTEQLQSCNVFHFAGHGFTDQQDPMNSYLCLQDFKATPLRVGDMLDLNLKEHPPFLAYLSACGTGQVQEERFMDESIHLVSACQLAGFRHVIGTLWEVNDEICVDVAKPVEVCTWRVGDSEIVG